MKSKYTMIILFIYNIHIYYLIFLHYFFYQIYYLTNLNELKMYYFLMYLKAPILIYIKYIYIKIY